MTMTAEQPAGPTETMARMGARARAAQRLLASAPTAAKAAAVRAAAAAIRAQATAIEAANQADMAAAADLSPALRDRLLLTPARIEGIAAALDELAALPDPVGETIREWSRPNGLLFRRVRVPLGVIGIIYESRPNVTADAGMLCVMAGNAAILRTGREALASAKAIHAALVEGLKAEGLPEDSIQLVDTPDRELVGAMLAAAGLIDVIIPRGGKGLVARVQAEARVPVLAHLDGNNHVYVDAAADPAMAREIVLNAKLRRTGVCGAMETLLIDRAYGPKAELLAALLEAGCELRADEALLPLDPRLKAATPEDWGTEYLEPIAAAAEVEGVQGAIAHIAAHGSHHTDAIVTADEAVAQRFLAAVDSAILMWNASTQFADGGEFGFGAEIGIATGRLHARGPVALEGLTTYKTLVLGSGQVRPV
ncbi:glutamate-5-semialdehyde dehydrogenase [Sandaracinobacter sp. RS1-74]|uniref:glutamate-5-semialdehyde dehydrogenase n=1 Tax=Sandaracinobacteroides sayramensis TaxID=2913411 RepID=UPI001EDBE252|nr:glutamate-5-semialdehyde dehydrogenase [Sandaracinobacteroides sayramensis]MCG2842675.1 glutamate-5-semialdehyde dehydrogenase [Sandaracinobacteroides sayramensis]